MKKRQAVSRVIALSLIITVAFFSSSCGEQQPQQHANHATANANTAGEATASATNSANSAPASNTGDPVDTSIFDAEINRLKRQAERNPSDEATRSALSRAYLQRANALRDARQYRAALGDYRRALQYDPDNEEAQKGAALIIARDGEAPAEGAEPTPLPVTPDAIAGDSGNTSPSASPSPANRNRRP